MRLSVGLLIFVVVGLVVVGKLADRAFIVNGLDFRRSPAEMAFIAKELVRALGYTDDPKDFAFGYKRGAETPTGPRKVPSGTNEVSSASNTVRFWFRQSPKYLSTSDLYYQGGTEPSLGRVTDTAPPWDTSGMAGVELDHRGFLRKLHAVPPTNNQTALVRRNPTGLKCFRRSESVLI